MILALAACGSPLPVLVSDLHGDRWFVGDARSGDVDVAYDLDEHHADECQVRDDTNRFCLVYQSRFRTAADGADEVDFTFTPVGSGGGEDPVGQDLGGRILGVRPTDPPTLAWRVDALDFSAFPDRCAPDPADPCAPDPAADADAQRACQLYWPHDFAVLGEDDAGVRLAVADTRNARVLWLTVPTGSTCAVVDEVLDGQNADWDVYTSVNSLQLWEEGDARRLLLSVKDTLGGADTGDGHGKILLWGDDDGDWAQRWEFPREGYVNAPHGATWDGEHVLFAHSLGRSTMWNAGEGGSVGVLDADGGYLFDGVLPHDVLRFPRDVTPLGDGGFLVVDTGGKGDEHGSLPTAIWEVEIDDWSAGEGDGAWTAGGSGQTFRDLLHARDRTFADGWAYYSVELAG